MFWWVGPLVALSWLSIALMPSPDSIYAYTIWAGYLLGSLFAHTTLAAAWTAFGPAPLIWRGPLSFVWTMTLPIAVGVNPDVRSVGSALIYGAVLFGLWLLLQFPLWAFALGLGIRLQHIEQPSEAVQLRFGIRHLLAIILFVGVVLGIGRIAGSMVSLPIANGGLISAFLAAAAIALTLPLLLMALMPRKAILGVLVSLPLLGIATIVVEEPLMEHLVGPVAFTSDLVAINLATALVILVVVGVVRLNGYCLARPAIKSS